MCGPESEGLIDLRLRIERRDARIDELEAGIEPLLSQAEERDARIAKLEVENERLQQWVHDLQADMYINCVYCGHRYGPDDEVPATMADALKEHIEQCPEHPMSALKAEVEKTRSKAEAWDGLLKNMHTALAFADKPGNTIESLLSWVKKAKLLEIEVERLKAKPCDDCCCARSWKALGDHYQVGASIPEAIKSVVAEVERLEAEAGQQSVRLVNCLASIGALQEKNAELKKWAEGTAKE